jgi:hypothetical protein
MMLFAVGAFWEFSTACFFCTIRFRSYMHYASSFTHRDFSRPGKRSVKVKLGLDSKSLQTSALYKCINNPSLLTIRSYHTMPPVSVTLSHWLSGVSLPGKYGLCAALVLFAWLFYHIGRDCLAWSLNLQRAVSWRRFLQSPVPSILHRLDILSYVQCLLLAALLTSNVVVLVFAAQSFAEVQKRAGSMAVIYLVPLFAGPTFSQASSLCRLSRDSLAWVHRWVGRACLVHCILHGTMIVELAHLSTPLSGPLLAAFGVISQSHMSWRVSSGFTFKMLIQYRQSSAFSQCYQLHLL